ncbi:hypothetical protein F2Q70_00042863 [Brassica cretica]|uniref:Uncharacterized protein n=1 Tax=Brassica cretica TaxID=69181 RepID=A0A8S9KHB2_BRACR|nr:hypothetical protein F2Q70_00042863 [Brassica cretica]
MAMILSSMRRLLLEEVSEKLPTCFTTVVLSVTCGGVWAAYSDKQNIRKRVHDAVGACGTVSQRLLVKQEAVNAEIMKLVKDVKMKRQS